MSRIGFIGLGIMGAPMAAHLVAAGHEVIGYDVVRKGVDALVAAGGSAAAGVPEAVGGAEIVVTMLPQDEHVEAVYFGSDGVLAHAAHGTLCIDFSTIRPETSIKVAEAGANAGCGYWTRRSAAARRVRRTPFCRSWSAAPRPTSPRRPRSSRRSGRPPNGSGSAVRASTSRPPTSSSSAAPSRWSPRRSC